MGNFITDQIVNVLNQKFGKIGQVADLNLSKDAVKITLDLVGETHPVTLEAHGLSWSVSDGKMNLFFTELVCQEKLWVQEIFKIVAEKTGRVISFPDSLKLMPLKMLLPKKR